jgi:hypothetical protein
VPTRLEVNGSRKGNNDERNGDDHERNAQYRLYEVQNGNHIESYVNIFPPLVVIQPHAQKAFDLLVGLVEAPSPLPPSQCVPKGGTISPSLALRNWAIARTCSYLNQHARTTRGGVGRLLLFSERDSSVTAGADRGDSHPLHFATGTGLAAHRATLIPPSMTSICPVI